MYKVNWDRVAEANNPESAEGLRNSFVVRGTGRWGGCQDIQSRLSEYGVCRFTRWDPRPPYWSFLFDTHLTRQQTLAALGSAGDSMQVTVE